MGKVELPMKATARNARLWIYYSPGDTWVKLTLKPGQTLAYGDSYSHDEGWTSTGSRYTHEGEHLMLEWFSDGTDCDGRLSQSGTLYCAIGKLQTKPSIDGQHMMPEWQELNSRQRDYAAETMGY